MNTTSLHIIIDQTTKTQAQRIADELGLSLSSVVKALLKQFIRTKELAVGMREIPNKYLLESLKQSDEDIKAGKTIKFNNTDEALAYIDDLIADDERKTKGHN